MDGEKGKIITTWQVLFRASKDAVHLACAHFSKAKFFLTCDDDLIKQTKRLKLDIEVMNPVDYIRERE